VPVAYTCSVEPAARLTNPDVVVPCVSVSVMAVSAAAETVTVAVFVTVVPLVSVTDAVIVGLPTATPVTSPAVPTVAKAVFDDV
jgi:hypothetical protein